MGGIWSSFCREGVREEEITQAKKDDQLQAGVEVSDNLNPRKEIPYIDEDVPEENELEPETNVEKTPLEKQDSESVPDYAPPAPPEEETEEAVQQKKAELEAQVEEQMITKQDVAEDQMVPTVASPTEVSPTIQQEAPEPPPPLEETAVPLSTNIKEPLQSDENIEEVPLIDFTQPDEQEDISEEQIQESIQMKGATEEGDKTVISETREEIKTEFHKEDPQQMEQAMESTTVEAAEQPEIPITNLPSESHDVEEKLAPATEEQTLPQAEPVLETATEVSQPSHETIPSPEQGAPLQLETETVDKEIPAEEQKEPEIIQTEMQEIAQAPLVPPPLETMPVEEHAQVTDSVPEETISPVESLPEPQPVQPAEAEQLTTDTQEQGQEVAEITEPQIAEMKNEEQPTEAEPILSEMQSGGQLIQGEEAEILVEPEPEIIVEEGTTLPEEIPVDEYTGDFPSPVLEEPTPAKEVPQEEIPQQSSEGNPPEAPMSEQAMPHEEAEQQRTAFEKEEHSEISISSEGDREVEELEKSAPLPEHMEGVTEEELEEEERRLIQQLMEHAEHDPDSQKLLDELLTHHQHPPPPPIHYKKEPLGTDEVSLNEAATRIQANYKGYILRKHLLQQKKQMEEQQRLAQEQQVLEPEQ